MKTNLYIDYSHLCYRTLFAVAQDIKEVGFGIMRHSILKNILYSINKFNPDRVYICCDDRRNWRKKLYAEYKGQRAAAKEKQDVDWVQFYATAEEVSDGFKVAFPFHVVKVPYLEADDIIAAMIRKNVSEEEHIVITSDNDYKQILQYKNTRVYDPMSRDFMKSLNPFVDLETKIIMGDKSDNIPAIAPRIGVKTAEKLIEGVAAYKDQTLQQLLENSEIKKNYDLNKKLIDLTKTPRDLIVLLEKYLAEYTLASTKGMFQYFINNGMRDMISKIETITRDLKRLNPGYIEPVKTQKESAGSFADLL